MIIDIIRNHISNGIVKWTNHCMEHIGERDISTDDVKNCIIHGRVIEEYPDDFPFPSCLICGPDTNGKSIHVVAGDSGNSAYMITAYIPSKDVFEDDYMTRRK